MSLKNKEKLESSFNSLEEALLKIKETIVKEGKRAFSEYDTEVIHKLSDLIKITDEMTNSIEEATKVINRERCDFGGYSPFGGGFGTGFKSESWGIEEDKEEKDETTNTDKDKTKRLKFGADVSYAEAVEFKEDDIGFKDIEVNGDEGKFPILVSIIADEYVNASCDIIEGKKAILIKGSIIVDIEDSSISKSNSAKRQKMILERKLVPREEGRGLLVTEDIIFDTPTMAASIVLGMKVHGGDKIWKGKHGLTLDTLLGIGNENTNKE